MVAVNAAGSDPFLRLERLMDLPDQDLHAVLKMQAIVAHTIQVNHLYTPLTHTCIHAYTFDIHRCRPS